MPQLADARYMAEMRRIADSEHVNVLLRSCAGACADTACAAQYCSTACQRADWCRHKADGCKA